MSDELWEPDHSPADEAGLLGCVLFAGVGDSQWANDIFDKVSPEDFFNPAHQSIFAVMRSLFMDAAPLEPMGVISALSRANELERVGGAAYVHRLYAGVVSPSYPYPYMEGVRTAAAKRRVREHATRLLSALRTCEDEEGVFAAVDAFTSQVTRTGLGDVNSQSLSEAVASALERADPNVPSVRPDPLLTGLRDVDAILGGMFPGQLVIVGGRPSAGKSLFSRVGFDSHVGVIFTGRVSAVSQDGCF